MKFTIKEGYKGDCAKCGKRAAGEHKHFVPFNPPIISRIEGLPDITGVYEYWCDLCALAIGTHHD